MPGNALTDAAALRGVLERLAGSQRDAREQRERAEGAGRADAVHGMSPGVFGASAAPSSRGQMAGCCGSS